MKPSKPPNSSHGLFPDTWVIGTAAAALAKNDEGVLLADDPDRAPSPPAAAQLEPRTPIADLRAPSTRSIEEELAELRAENERLRRVIAGSRGDLDAVNWLEDDIVASGEPDGFSDPRLFFDDGPRRLHGRGGHGDSASVARHALIAGVLVITLGALAAAWLAGQRLAAMDGPLVERIEMLGDDIAGAVGGLRGRALAWLSPQPRPVADDHGARGAAQGLPAEE